MSEEAKRMHVARFTSALARYGAALATVEVNRVMFQIATKRLEEGERERDAAQKALQIEASECAKAQIEPEQLSRGDA